MMRWSYTLRSLTRQLLLVSMIDLALGDHGKVDVDAKSAQTSNYLPNR